ncbi:hypothetical protein HanXRQr2_Chr09g0399561 [Helianthus annuus]|uniref:Uncharacterized protein n=1 Tax=Helianthus annuus TaxID=4232 RepID=A0A9K3N9E2_HELAN|nr:hypothetical protein HanXRQr2_Chr09g0399561 [Helianthus annuus]KAJ0894102.1 hypothetical protein HanPSC8_Chr09g0385351 [Helianthus annuus]
MIDDARSTGSAQASATDSSERTTVRPKCTPVHYPTLNKTVISRHCTTVRPKCTTVHILVSEVNLPTCPLV